MSSTPEPPGRDTGKLPGPRLHFHTSSPNKLTKHGISGPGSPSGASPNPPRLPPIATNVGAKLPKVRHSSALPALTLDMDDATNGHQSLELDPAPAMPSFLKLEREDIDAKFEDINWDERIRLTKSQPHHPNFEWKWSTFKQADVQERGAMDRYVNIKPWNHNRVKLMVDDEQLGYVNASHINMTSPSDKSSRPLRYIAMQGPTEPSVPYVWRMIAEQTESPSVIVQLTSNTEAGAVKCNQYFPHDVAGAQWRLNEDDVWGDGWKATLTYESVEHLYNDAIEKRKLSLKIDGEENARTVWHLWYRRWPDFGVPSPTDCDSFFELMRLSRDNNSSDGPRIIHCSAGVGRTGTFIALEHLMRELDAGALYDPSSDAEAATPGSKPDLIYDTVQQLRQQRKGMVQSEQQYRFLYQVLRKLWSDPWGSLDEDEEDGVDGGVVLTNSARPSKPGSPATTPDQSTDVESYDEDVDDEEGGAKVKSDSGDSSGSKLGPGSSGSAGEKNKSAGRSSPTSRRAMMMKKRAKRLLFD